MSDHVVYPEMRLQILSAVQSLSSAALQKMWLSGVPDGVQYYDDLALVCHVLYDDTEVLPDPASAVPSLIYPKEVSLFANLEEFLGPMVNDLQNSKDEVYLSDARWPRVMSAAKQVYDLMVLSDQVADNHNGPTSRD